MADHSETQLKRDLQNESLSGHVFLCVAMIYFSLLILLVYERPPLNRYALFWTWYYSVWGVAFSLAIGAGIAFVIKRRIYFFVICFAALYPPFVIGRLATVSGGAPPYAYQLSRVGWFVETLFLGSIFTLTIYYLERKLGPLKFRFSIGTLLVACVFIAFIAYRFQSFLAE